MTEKTDSPKPSPIDMETALERTGDDKEFLFDLIQIFMEDFDPKAAELKSAINDQNFTSIQEIGHYLKGSSANLSLIQIMEISYQIEIAGKESDLEKARENLELLSKEYVYFKEYFAEMKK
jgi:HPt (histidine-containing phosphotransfer) domain-containing protein